MAGYIGSKASVVSSGAERKKVFDITATTTSLTGCSYTPNQVHVFHNGVRLVDGTDYTATDGSTVTLTTAAQSGDEVVVISYATFQTSDTVSASAGGTFTGDVTFSNKVGIGTTSPVDTFHAVGSDGATSRTTYQGATEFIFENNGDFSIDLSTGNANQAFINWHDTDAVQQGWLSYNHNGDYMRFGVNGAERMRVKDSAISGFNETAFKLQHYQQASSAYTATEISSDISGASAALVFKTNNNWTNGNASEVARVRADGWFAITGNGNIPASTLGVAINKNGRYLSWCDSDWNLELGGSQGNRIRFYSSNGSGTTVGSITVNTSSTSYNTSSDYRLKENVTPLDGAADRLAQIPVHRFNFIDDPDTTVDGFLAHEVQAIVPEAITGEKDAVETVDVTDEGGNVTGTETRPVYQGIDQSKLVPLLTAALQEALQKIDALEARVAALEAV